MQNSLDHFLSDLANKIQTAKEYKDIIKDSQNVDVNKNVFEGFMLGVAETIKKELKERQPETTQIEAVSSIADQQKNPETQPQEDPLAKFVTTLASTISASKNKPIEQETKDEDEEKKVEGTPVPAPAPEPQQDSFEKFIDNLKDIIQKNPKELPAASLPIVNKKDKLKAGVKDYVKELVKKPKDENEEKPKSKSDLIKDLVRKFVEGEIKGFKDEISQKFNQVGAAYGGGGGTNAVQYANGGTMNGDLNVNGHILSGGKDISNYFGGSGGGSQTLSFNESNADLSISGGNTVSLSALSGGVSGPTDRLVNGSYQVVLSSDGTLFLPGSGTIANIASVAQIGFEINGLFNYAGQTSVGLNTFNAGLGNPAWGPAIQANPTDYEIIFNGGLVATITSAAGTASPGARWDFTGSWPANPTGAPVTIRAKNYTPGIQGTDGIRLAANNNSWTFGADGSLSFPANLKIANSIISNVFDTGLGLVVGSQIAVSGSKTSISNGTTNTVGDSVLATGGRVDVESNRSAIAYEVLNSLGDSGPTLTSQILVEARGYPDNDVRIGTKLSNTTDGITLTSFSGWSFGTYGSLTFPDNTTQTTAYTGIPDNIAYTNQNTIFEKNVTIQGNLTALGTSTFANTIFTTTSALSVINTGPGPALYVFQAAGASDVASFYDGDGIEVLHVGNAQGGGNPLGQVGINTSFPSVELTVVGNISANSNITGYNVSTQNQVKYLSSGVVKVYQYYNATTNSLDTVFA